MTKGDDGLNPLGRWLKLVHSCDCGSQEPYERWHEDASGNKLFKVCKGCRERKIREYNEKTKQEEEKTEA